MQGKPIKVGRGREALGCWGGELDVTRVEVCVCAVTGARRAMAGCGAHSLGDLNCCVCLCACAQRAEELQREEEELKERMSRNFKLGKQAYEVRGGAGGPAGGGVRDRPPGGGMRGVCKGRGRCKGWSLLRAVPPSVCRSCWYWLRTCASK